MLKFDNQAESGPIGHFMSWWGKQLLSFIPEKYRQFLVKNHHYLLFALDDDHIRVWQVADNETRSLGRFSTEDTDLDELDRLLSDSEYEKAQQVLILVSKQVLVKQFKLPLAAKSNLRQVVGFEMDRRTPFKAEQVYYDVHITEQLKDTKKINVELALAPKDKLDAILTALEDWEIEPERVDIAQIDDYRPRYNLLPEAIRPKINHWPKIASILLGISLFLILVAALLLPLWRERALAIEAIDRVEAASSKANEVNVLKTEADRVAHEMHFMLDKKSKQPVLTDVLDELALRLPDDTWLTNLTYKDNGLQIQGQSPAASGLIEIIEESAVFANTRFVSPITEDRTTKQERFQIATDVTYRIQKSVRSAE